MSLVRRISSSAARNFKVYRTFKALDIDGKTQVEYRIQEYPKDRIEEGVAFNLDSFFRHEPMSKSRNAIDDPLARKEFAQAMRETLQHGVCLACLKENSDEIISTNLMAVKDEADYMQRPDFTAQVLVDTFDAISYANTQFNPFKHYNVEHLLYAFTVGVKPDYRGRGIASQMFECRPLVCQHLKLKLTTTHATATGSQKAAAHAGFEENFVIKYKDLLKINPKFNFPNIDTKFFKIMSLKI